MSKTIENGRIKSTMLGMEDHGIAALRREQEERESGIRRSKYL